MKTRWTILLSGAFAVGTFIIVDGPLWIYEAAKRVPESAVEARWSGSWQGAPMIEKEAKKIIAFSLERTGCLGTCPVYVLRVERSRRALYEGRAFVSRVGHFEGKVYGFDQLAYFATGKLLALKEAYDSPITCQSTTILTIETESGVKRISDYGGSGPNDFLIFCSALDGVAEQIEWAEEKEANQAPEPTARLRPAAAHL